MVASIICSDSDPSWSGSYFGGNKSIVCYILSFVLFAIFFFVVEEGIAFFFVVEEEM